MTTFWLWVFWGTVAVLAYVHFGYRALLAMLGWRPVRDVPEAELPTVTLIIPAHNEEVVLEEKLENAVRIDYPREKLEILVASDGSSDRTIEIAERFEERDVRALAFGNRRGKTSVLNDAVSSATGEVLCFCDANVMFQPDALKVLVGRLSDTKIGAASGEVRLASHESNFEHGESLYYVLERHVQLAESRLGSLMGVDGGMYVMHKELFRPLPADTILDDFVVSMHVIGQGRRVVYEPRALATENGTPLASQEYRRRVRVSAGAVQSLKRSDFPPLSRPIELWQYVSHKLLRWLGPLWLLLLLVASAALWNASVFYRGVFIAQVVVYLVALAATLSVRLRRTRIGGVCFYLVMSHFAMAVGLVKGIFNRQKVTWAKADRHQTPEALKSAVIE